VLRVSLFAYDHLLSFPLSFKSNGSSLRHQVLWSLSSFLPSFFHKSPATPQGGRAFPFRNFSFCPLSRSPLFHGPPSPPFVPPVIIGVGPALRSSLTPLMPSCTICFFHLHPILFAPFTVGNILSFTPLRRITGGCVPV